MGEDDLKRRAEAAGLARMLKAFPEQAKAALQSAAVLASKLPRDLAAAEEPAHVFSLAPKGGERT